MKTGNIHLYRRLTQALFFLLIILIPVFDIFRFDSDLRSLIVFGNEWDLGLKVGFDLNPSFGNASHVAWRFFLKAILPWIAVLAVFPILGAITGRFFCGWFCPEGALFELFDFLTVKVLGRRSLFTKKPNDPEQGEGKRIFYAIGAVVGIVVIPLFLGVMMTGYFVKPSTVWSQVLNWEFTFGVKAGIIGVAIYAFISSMIVRHALCKYVCSAGLMLMLFGWASPVSLRIKTDPDKLSLCTDCKGCEKVCFMNVKPRMPKKDINCVNCGECIVACQKELGVENCIFSYSQSRLCDIPPREAVDKSGRDLLNLNKYVGG